MKTAYTFIFFIWFGLLQGQQTSIIKDLTVGGEHFESMMSITQDEDGNKYVLTSSRSPQGTGVKTAELFGQKNGNTFFDYWAYKINTDDEIEWDVSFGTDTNDSPIKILCHDDHLYLCGYSRSGVSGNKTSINYGESDYWVVKTDLQGNKVWDKTYGGNDNDVLKGAQLLSDGNILLFGHSSSPVSGNKSAEKRGDSDIWIVKIAPDGSILNEYSYTGGIGESPTKISEDKDGNLLIVAGSPSGAQYDKEDSLYGVADVWALKLNAAGKLINQASFGGEGFEWIPEIYVTEDAYYIASRSNSKVSGNKTVDPILEGSTDIWLIKTDTSFNDIWQKSIGGEGNEGFTGSIEIQGKDENILVGFTTTSDGSTGNLNTVAGYGSEDYVLVEVNPEGELLEFYRAGGDEGDFFNQFLRTSSNQLIVSGVSYSNTSGVKSQDTYGNGTLDNWHVWFDIPVFTEELVVPKEKISIYPNPAVYQIRFEVSQETDYEKYTLVDLSGREIISERVLPGNDNIVDLSGYPSGVYMIRLEGKGKSMVKKIVKQ